MNPETVALQARTRKFFVRVIRLSERLPHTLAAQRIAPQLLDAAGSTNSNYRAACRGRSRREFMAKLGVAVEEADEAKDWLETLVEAGIGDTTEAATLAKEANELVAILVASLKTARRNEGK
jgi:four helix bundle protein